MKKTSSSDQQLAQNLETHGERKQKWQKVKVYEIDFQNLMIRTRSRNRSLGSNTKLVLEAYQRICDKT